VGLYVTMHLLNHALGLVSVDAQEAARPWVMAFWHSAPGQLLLYGSVAVHASLGLAALYRRRHFRVARWEAAQLLLGLAVPYLLLVHIVNTRGTRLLAGIDITYPYEIAHLWLNPWSRFRQVTLVLLVWGHFSVGLHFWLRLKSWYRKAWLPILLAYVLVPVLGLLGFAEAGLQVAARSRADPEWHRMIARAGVPADRRRAQVRVALQNWAGPAWLSFAGAVFFAGQARNWLERRKCFGVTYPEGDAVRAPIGMSVLEVSRMIERPHVSVCGGRGRCTTCRVEAIPAMGELPAPDEIEVRALNRIGAPAGVRLACQLRPAVDLSVWPLLRMPRDAGELRDSSGAVDVGEERQMTILFIDLRGSTQLAETRLPYDVVYLLNHFFAEMSEAIDGERGHYSNFTGDGLMALFGLGSRSDNGARAALKCALAMLEKLERLNGRLSRVMDAPLAIGIGIHTGEAIVGRMGPPRTPILSALGDSVNTAARLEAMTKELHLPVVASYETLQAAKVNSTAPLQFVLLRGRSCRMAVSAFDAEGLRELLERA
jgi:adenylate cyclase